MQSHQYEYLGACIYNNLHVIFIICSSKQPRWYFHWTIYLFFKWANKKSFSPLPGSRERHAVLMSPWAAARTPPPSAVGLFRQRKRLRTPQRGFWPWRVGAFAYCTVKVSPHIKQLPLLLRNLPPRPEKPPALLLPLLLRRWRRRGSRRWWRRSKPTHGGV